MTSNLEYLQDFIQKHHYNNEIHVQCYKDLDYDSIKYVIFNKQDIPSETKINMEDIRYDIDTDLPEDVFYRWLEYINDKENDEVSYIYWMTKMDNHYFPMNIDNSESEKMKTLIYDKLNELKNMRWF